MNFIYPTFLFGLLAIAIPVLIHLFNLQRPRKVLFPNVRFLKAVQQTTTQKLKLKHLLILFSRILFIVCLVLMFAQPVWRKSGSSTPDGLKQVTTYIDNSFSMQNEVDQEKVLNIALKSAESLSNLYPSQTPYTLLTNEFEGRDMFPRNRDKFKERLSEVDFGNLYRETPAVLQRSSSQTQQGNAKRELYYFSDFQQATLGTMDKLKEDTSTQFYLVPLANKDVSNVFIDSIYLSSPIVRASENNQLNVRIANSGNRAVDGLVVKVYADEIQVASKELRIEANANLQTDFVLNFNSEGTKKCVIRFEDQPVVFDNEYFFIVQVSPKINILHLYENESGYVSRVYTNESAFALNTFPVGDFEYSLLEKQDLIVLENIRQIPNALNEPLMRFVNKGGSLAIYPSSEPEMGTYNGLLKGFLLPTLNRLQVDTSLKLEAELLPPDLSNPFYNNIFERKGQLTMPFAFSNLGLPPGSESLLRFKNGSSFLSRYSFGDGKVYLFSAGLQTSQTNFHQHALFVPIMYKLAFHSVRTNEDMAYSFQQNTIGVDVGPNLLEQSFTLEGQGIKTIPVQRLSGKVAYLELPREQMKPGFYDLKQSDKTIKTIALNYGKKESIMGFADAESLKKQFAGQKNVRILEIQNNEEFERTLREQKLGTPLWKWFLLGCLLFLLAEVLLIRYWK